MMHRAAHGALVIVVLATATVMAAPGPAVLEVKSTLAGVVLAEELVEAGTRVEDAQPLVYVRTSLTGTRAVAARAPREGVVREVLVAPGQRVERGDVVIRIDPR